MTLSPESRSFYEQNGYLVIEGLLGVEWLRDLRSAVRELLAAARAVATSNSVYDIGPGHTPDHPCVRRIKDPQHRHPVFDALMRSPEIVDIVAELLGGTVRFDHAKLNFKPAGGQASIEWHQDWAFYPHTNDDLLAVGIMIEECTPDNGPLMVLPGTHKGGIFNHHHDDIFVGAIPREDLAHLLPSAVALTAPAGSVSVHHVRTVHGSGDNKSGSTRPLLLFSYAAVDAFPVFEKPDLTDFDGRILRGAATRVARQVALPVRIPEPRDMQADSIFDNQAPVQGRSFGALVPGLGAQGR